MQSEDILNRLKTTAAQVILEIVNTNASRDDRAEALDFIKGTASIYNHQVLRETLNDPAVQS